MSTKKNTKDSKKTYATTKYVKKMLASNVENKHNFNYLAIMLPSISSSWTEHVLTNISPGSSGNNRIGRRLSVKYLELRGVLAGGNSLTAADDPYSVVRIVLGQWKTQSAPLTTATVTMNMPIMKNMNGCQGLEKKYYDKYIPLNVATAEAGAGDGYCPLIRNFHFRKYFKKPLVITFGDDTSNTSDHNIVLSCMSSSGIIPHPGFINGYYLISWEDA